MENSKIDCIKNIIKDFEKANNVKLEYIPPVKQEQQAFAIKGNMMELDRYYNEFLFLFSDLNIKHNSSFYCSFSEEKPKYIMHIYECK